MPVRLRQAVCRIVAATVDPRTDAGLVSDFLHSADEDAFAELVRRHGPMVLGVCRRFLGHTPDAADAFQATFLVLIRRARRTDWRASLGPWLYGVALRVARKARMTRSRRLATERQVPLMAHEPAAKLHEPDDLASVLDEELAALPDTFRRPLVLCELQGKSRREAASELGLAEGTLSSRLARGRRMLRDRLARRGVAPTVAGLAVAVPAELAAATTHHAVALLSRTAGAVPTAVLSLTEGVVKAMIVKWKLAAVTVATCLGLSGFGMWQTAISPAAQPKNQPVPAVPPAKAIAPKEPVATIFGDVPITREAFAEHLIRRYGKKELELFVNKQVIAHAFAQQGWTLTPAEVQAALDADCKVLGITREQFATDMLPRHDRSMTDWVEDVVAPRLMLTRLCETRITAPTEEELRRAFKVKYGEKLDGRIIVWANEAEARAAYEKVRGSEKEFDAHARRQRNAGQSWSGMAADGRVVPITRARPLDDNKAEQPIYAAIEKLQAGEVSALVPFEQEGKRGFLVFKCDRVIPTDDSKSFEKEKPMLLADVLNAKVGNEIPKLFAVLKQQAKPQIHLTFPDPQPTGAKK